MYLQRALLLAVFLAPTLHAADPSGTDTIIVTATRSEISIKDAIVPVSVITRDDIELSGAADLAELLRFHAGIDIGRNGGPGQATSVFLRGTESNHTLILVDGVRMNPGTIGGGAIQHISPAVIERVEIVKGARSALFGTDAIGGVINIITRRTDDTRMEAGLGAGSFDTQSAYLSAGLRDSDSEYGLTADWSDTDGYSPLSNAGIDRGYANLSLNLFASRQLGDNEIALRHWDAAGNVEYFDFFESPVDQDFRNSTTSAEWERSFGEDANSALIVSYVQDRIDQKQSPDYVHSDRVSVDWQFTRGAGNHLLTAGLFAMDETAEALSFGSGFNEDTDVRAIFVQDQWSSGRHRAFGALRLTDHSSFGSEVTWNAEYAYDVTDSLVASIGAGRAYRAPDASDRFGFGGNVDLDPEVSSEVQLGLRFRPATRHSMALELYANNIDDLIEFEFVNFTLVNVARAEIRGAQLGYEYAGDDFTFRGEFVRQDANNEADGTRLLRRADQHLTLSYVQSLGEHSVGLSVLASGDREDFGGTRLSGYVLANLTAQISLGERWQVNARFENILDTQYETAANFRMQDRSAFLDLNYKWK